MMWQLVSHLLLFMLGIAVGVILMCLMQVSKKTDEQMEDYNKRRNAE